MRRGIKRTYGPRSSEPSVSGGPSLIDEHIDEQIFWPIYLNIHDVLFLLENLARPTGVEPVTS